MTKGSLLLVLLALVAGFYLGSNPASREKVTQTWDSAKTFFIDAGAKVTANVPSTSANPDNQPQTNGDRPGNIGPQPENPIDFTQIWQAIRGFWLQITSKLKLGTS